MRNLRMIRIVKTVIKPTQKRPAPRDLFDDLREGVAALADSRQGKRTLRTHAVAYKPAPKVTPKDCHGKL